MQSSIGFKGTVHIVYPPNIQPNQNTSQQAAALKKDLVPVIDHLIPQDDKLTVTLKPKNGMDKGILTPENTMADVKATYHGKYCCIIESWREPFAVAEPPKTQRPLIGKIKYKTYHYVANQQELAAKYKDKESSKTTQHPEIVVYKPKN